MKRVIKLAVALLCVIFALSFAACKDDGASESETKEQALEKVNAAIERMWSEGTVVHVDVETIETMDDFSRTSTIGAKIIDKENGQKAHVRLTEFGALRHEFYYVDGYEYNPGVFGITEVDFYSFITRCFYHGHLPQVARLEASDIESWTKSNQTYKFKLANTRIFKVADEFIDQHSYFLTDLTVSMNIVIDDNGDLRIINFAVGFLVDGNSYSHVTNITFNTFGDAVTIDVPDGVLDEINDYIERFGQTDKQVWA